MSKRKTTCRDCKHFKGQGNKCFRTCSARHLEKKCDYFEEKDISRAWFDACVEESGSINPDAMDSLRYAQMCRPITRREDWERPSADSIKNKNKESTMRGTKQSIQKQIEDLQEQMNDAPDESEKNKSKNLSISKNENGYIIQSQDRDDMNGHYKKFSALTHEDICTVIKNNLA